jgi:hypothetical protein
LKVGIKGGIVRPSISQLLKDSSSKGVIMYHREFSSRSSTTRVTAFVTGVLLLFGFLTSLKTASSQVPDQEAIKQPIENVPLGQEKKLGIGIPAHIPLKIKVRNVNSKKWAHDIEVEVTNTSEKPIYFLSLYLNLPGINGLLGSKVGFWLRYGRVELMSFSAPLKPDDLPIQPGGKYTFKIPESSAKGWDYLREKERRPEPKVMKLIFQVLNFGDGTGFLDTSGAPVNIHKKISVNRACNPPPNGSAYSSIKLFSSFLPASSLPVKFLWSSDLNSLPTVALSNPDLCCTGTQSHCSFVKLGSYVCGRTCSDNPNRPSANFVGCTDPEGSCRVIDYVNDTCIDPGSGVPLTCVDAQLSPCCPECGVEEGEARCTDGIDNDGDGIIDCDEPGCFLYCPPPCDEFGERPTTLVR